LSRDEAHLLDILKAARLAIEFKGAANRPDFLKTPRHSRQFCTNSW
jgi:hypothetical protein